MENKKVIILVSVLVCFSIVVSLVSATNYYNYVYNGTVWVPMLSTADGQKKVWLEMKNCSYGNVQEDLVVGGNMTLGQKITFALGEIIDNIVDGWVRITGGLNVVNSTGDSKFFVNVTSGNVGVGTTAPGSTLDVHGDVNVSGAISGTSLIGLTTQLAMAYGGTGNAGGSANQKLFMNADGNGTEWATGIKMGTFTRDTSLASGTQEITGVGFKPAYVIFMGGIHAANKQTSFGFDDGTLHYEVSTYDNADLDQWYIYHDDSIRFQGTAASYRGHITTLGADGFTITWVKQGDKTETATIFYMAFR